MKKQTFSLLLIAFILSYTTLTKAQSQYQPCHYEAHGTTGKDWHLPSDRNVVGAMDGDPAYDCLGAYGTSTTYPYISNLLKLTQFQFAVPSNATIKGIEVYFVYIASSTNCVKDHMVKLYYNGSPIGNNNKKSAYWNTIYTISTYGSSTSLWGNALTPSKVNSPTFGVGLMCVNMDLYNGQGVCVDYCAMKVYYTVGSKLMSQESTDRPVNDLNVFPNPVSGVLNLNSSEMLENSSINIVDLTGKVVYGQRGISLNPNEPRQIDVSTLSSGNYVIELSSGDKRRTKRFIKQ